MFFHIDDSLAHQLIFSDGSNTTMENALYIPDPQISWAMYGELENNVLFYKFEAKQKEPLYASLVIPALDGLEDFSPSLAIITQQQNIAMISSHTDEKNTEVPLYYQMGTKQLFLIMMVNLQTMYFTSH